MADRESGSPNIPSAAQLHTFQTSLRPGAILGVVVIAVVGLVGIVQWNQGLIITGFVAGVAIMALNAVVVAVRFWHKRNTQPEATYVDAEEFVKLRRRTR